MLVAEGRGQRLSIEAVMDLVSFESSLDAPTSPSSRPLAFSVALQFKRWRAHV
jgi:hypothetical protein